MSVTLLLSSDIVCFLKDTLLALQALKQFSFSQTNRAFYNLQLEFVCSSNDTWHYVVSLDRTNFASLQSFPVSLAFQVANDDFYHVLLFFYVLAEQYTIAIIYAQFMIQLNHFSCV